MAAAWCASHSLIRLTDAEIDVLAGDALAAAVTNNEAGIRLCGW